jgi:hypothetical protein
MINDKQALCSLAMALYVVDTEEATEQEKGEVFYSLRLVFYFSSWQRGDKGGSLSRYLIKKLFFSSFAWAICVVKKCARSLDITEKVVKHMVG